MLPVALSQILFGVSVIGLATVVVRKFPELRSIEIGDEEHETFSHFLKVRFAKTERKTRVWYAHAKAFYFKLLTRVLHYVKILSLKLEARTTTMLHKVKERPMAADAALFAEEESAEAETAAGNRILEKSGKVFFENLKGDTNHRKVNGKLRNLKNGGGEE